MIYADAAATTPVHREVLAAMWPYLTAEFGNPSSAHELGERAADALAAAREQVAAAFGARPGEVVFTSSGTEANTLGIVGLALGAVTSHRRGRHIITSATEHPSVFAATDHLQRWHGFEVTVLDVTPDGQVTVAALSAALRADTALVSIHYANNEIGAMQDVERLSSLAREEGALFHTDAVQGACGIPISLTKLGVDALSISGHKIGAPKGIGALVMKATAPFEPPLAGGSQERGRRPGTQNVAGAVGLGVAAAKLAARRNDPNTGVAALTACRDALISGVLSQVPGAILTGPDPRHALLERHPGHASFCFPGANGEAVLRELERLGVIASAGSACAAGREDPSPVLLALGLSPEVAQTSMRLTFDAPLDVGVVIAAVARAVAAVRRLAESPAGEGFLA
ncbi:MAG: cysteine desulfurase [Promicromonosporaceae bacterium]|nr:cysteine desulfurase [Promicromonosporaceae bacterium]